MKFLKIKDDTYLNISLISEVQFGKRPKMGAVPFRGAEIPVETTQEVTARIIMANSEPRDIAGELACKLQQILEATCVK